MIHRSYFVHRLALASGVKQGEQLSSVLAQSLQAHLLNT